MTRDKLKKRLTRIEATPLPPTVPPVNNNRRGDNYVDMNVEEVLSHDDFFDFEQDLVELKSSRNLAAEAPNSYEFFHTDDVVSASESKKPEQSYIVMEEVPEEKKPKLSGIILEELDDEETNIETSNVESPQAKAVGFVFVQCEATKKNGERCKRQAPKNSTICSIHRKQIEKKSSINKKEDG